MKASRIEFEIGYNNQCQIIAYHDIDFDKAYKKLKKAYGNVIIYSVKTEY